MDSSFSQVGASSDGFEFNILKLQNSYDSFAGSLELQYQSANGDSKFFVLSNIINKGQNNNTLSLKQYSVIGIANQVLPQNGWKWGLGLGKCDGTYFGKDATDVIESMNSVNVYNPALPGQYVYHTSNDFILILQSDVPLPSGSNPFGFFDTELFMGPSNTCMNNTMITYYYNFYKTFASRFTPVNKASIFSDLTSGVFPYTKSGTGAHEVMLTYGTLHAATIPTN